MQTKIEILNEALEVQKGLNREIRELKEEIRMLKDLDVSEISITPKWGNSRHNKVTISFNQIKGELSLHFGRSILISPTSSNAINILVK